MAQLYKIELQIKSHLLCMHVGIQIVWRRQTNQGRRSLLVAYSEPRWARNRRAIYTTVSVPPFLQLSYG